MNDLDKTYDTMRTAIDEWGDSNRKTINEWHDGMTKAANDSCELHEYYSINRPLCLYWCVLGVVFGLLGIVLAIVVNRPLLGLARVWWVCIYSAGIVVCALGCRWHWRAIKKWETRHERS